MKMQAKLMTGALVALMAAMVMTATATQYHVRDAGAVQYRTGTTPLTNGNVIALGSRFGVVGADAATNTDVLVYVSGIYDLPVLSNAIVTVGAKLYWVAASGVCTTNPASGAFIGMADEAQASMSTTTYRRRVDLNAYPASVLGPYELGGNILHASISNVVGNTSTTITNLFVTGGVVKSNVLSVVNGKVTITEL